MVMPILDLCSGSGEWSRPYREAGYDVIQVDVKDGQDVRLLEVLPYPVRGILAAPPREAEKQGLHSCNAAKR